MRCWGEAALGSSATNADQDEEDILKGIWPGSHNVHLLTHFVTCHFAGDWTDYLLFCLLGRLKASGVPIGLVEWLEEEDHTVNENRGGADIGSGGPCCRGLVEGNILNTCNEACSVPLSHLGSDIFGNKASLRSAGSIPSKKGPCRHRRLYITHISVPCFLPLHGFAHSTSSQLNR